MEELERLEARVAALEARLAQTGSAAAPPLVASAAAPAVPVSAPAAAAPASPPAAPSVTPPDILHGTTINGLFDGYYEFNFNRPVGRVNVIRAFDVLSNSFSINQAGLVIENAPDPDNGKRWGARLDLQFGQATQTLQGSLLFETRPSIYQNIFQAYGTYVFPVGRGLTVDFGKWASTLGIEGTYTKDQMNYSRSLWFSGLPYYHAGVRAAWKATDYLTVNYWLTNGIGRTEAADNFHDEMFGFNYTRGKLNWTSNYYYGNDNPDITFQIGNASPATLPSLQGTPFLPLPHQNGHLHIVDNYFTLQATPRLTFAASADYIIDRTYSNAEPLFHVEGGAGYARYQFTPKFAIAARAEYQADHGGILTGATQALREGTFTLEYKLAEGFLVREEWRTDLSNQPLFYTPVEGVLRKDQNTVTTGLVWWFGGKTGVW